MLAWLYIVIVLQVAPVSAIGAQCGSEAETNTNKQTKGVAMIQSRASRQPKVQTQFGIDDHQAALGASGVLPPKCPADVSENGAYFQEYVYPDPYHTNCDYRHPCNKTGTNLERLNSIRGLLGAAKTLLDGLQIQYAIYGGSAIGQQRCGDVLPWDHDCDVVVWEEDVHKITKGDLNSPYTVIPKPVKEKQYAVPYEVMDKSTGFFCDIFFMKYNADTHHVEFANPSGSHVCGNLSTSRPFSKDVKKCNRYPAQVVAPFVPCTLNGVQHTCMKDQLAYLKLEYGDDVNKADVQTNLVKMRLGQSASPTLQA